MVTLQVGAVGTGPLSYQWRFNGTNLPDSSVANLATLTLTNVSVADVGDYQVSITNPYGSVTSSLAALTLAVPPIITTQPASQTVPVGGTVSLQVKATGVGPFTYQWQFNGTNLLNGVITTVVGGGVGDGGLATNATLVQPSGVAWDLAGNPLIADTGNNRIRNVDTNGIITTVAGSGSPGYSGDGGVATRAGLNQPASVTADRSGNWLIADGAHNIIRRVASDGTITTIAGNGQWGYLGDGGPATNASLANPSGVALDSVGDLFTADSLNNRIRKVDTNGIITTVAGNRNQGYSGDGTVATNASLAGPSGVAVDLAGNVFIADRYNNRIRKVDTNGIITTVAGNGRFGYGGDGRAATNASLANPAGLAIDHVGNLLIADSNNARIRKMDTNGIITTVAGNGQFGYSGDGGAATKATLANPVGVAVDQFGSLLIADPFCNCIRKVSTNGIITTVAGSNTKRLGDGGAATSASLQSPAGLAVDTVGNLLVADTGNARVRRVGADHIITTLAGNGQITYSGDGGPATNTSLANPSGVAVDAAGNVFIADSWNNRIREVDTRGIIHAVAGNGRWGYLGDGGAATNASLANPSGAAFDSAGNLFIADSGNNCVRQVNADGLITTLAGNGQFGYSGDGGAATRANLSSPRGVAVASTGTVFIADTYNNRIRKVDPNGLITTVAGNGRFGYFGDGGPATNASLANPSGVAVDLGGNLFIADQANARIRRVGADGIITTVAGNGTQGFAGDGYLATNASLASPSGVAVYGFGRVFIADTENSRIRQVVLSDFPTLILTGVSATNAGDYQVTITNPFGSVTSLVARVTLASSPIVLSIRAEPAVLLQLTGQPGALYLLQAATNLTLPVQWQPVFTNAADANGLWSYTDTNAFALPARFYRARPAQ